jgi:hypothetical protein
MLENLAEHGHFGVDGASGLSVLLSLMLQSGNVLNANIEKQTLAEIIP